MATQEEQRFLDGLLTNGGIKPSLEIVEMVSSMRIKYLQIEKKVVLNNDTTCFQSAYEFCFH